MSPWTINGPGLFFWFWTFFLAGCVTTHKIDDLDRLGAVNKAAKVAQSPHARLSQLQKLSVEKPVLVMMGATWCEACMETKPDFIIFGEDHAQEFSSVYLDVDENPQFKKETSVDSYPSFFLFMNGELEFHLNGASKLNVIRTAFQNLNYKFSVPLAYASHNENLSARVFLVAGSSKVANFAQEILEQKKFWQTQGIPSQQIACYYARPSLLDYAFDREQFDRLAPDLKDCFKADVSKIKNDIMRNGKQSHAALYFYVSSHGTDPARVQNTLDVFAEDDDDLKDCTNYVDYQIDIGESTDIPEAELNEVKDVCRGKIALQDAEFVPRTLQSALASWPKSTPKFVVLQACYSGGFIAPHAQSLTTSVDNLTLLTSSRFDRTSFGCDEEGQRTYFGEAFMGALKKNPALPERLDWRKLFKVTTRRVQRLENKEGFKSSYPQIHLPTAH